MSRRKTIAEKQTVNTYRADRDKPTPAFTPSKNAKPPAYLRPNKFALEEWKRVAPHLEAEGILKETDLSLLASYCLLYARWREAAADVETRGQIITITSTTRTGMTQKPVVNPSVRAELLYQQAMLKTGVKFGLNALDRSRVETTPVEEDDPFQRFLDEVD